MPVADSFAQCQREHGPLWVIASATGMHRGHMRTFSDRGGHDVTYIFDGHCGRTLVASGSVLEASHLAPEGDPGICDHAKRA